jgi:hypothetical protein
VHREAPDTHRSRLDAFDRRVVEMIRRPRTLTVVEKAAPEAIPVLNRRHVIASFDDDHANAALVSEFLRHHRGGDSGADDADVGFDHTRAHEERPSPVPRLPS